MVSVPPSEVGLDPDRVARLIDLAGKKVRAARLPSAQLAIARHGRLAAVCTLTPDAEPTQEAQPLYVGFSTTKALISAAVWLLMQDGQLTPERLVSELIQEPTLPSMEGVTVQHLMTHTAGFPDARLDPPMDWEDREARLAHFARWESQWPPGSRFCYHPTATMWVLAEVIERTSGQDFRDHAFDSDFAGNRLRGLAIVAGEHHGHDAERLQTGNRLSRVRLDRIGHADDAE